MDGFRYGSSGKRSGRHVYTLGLFGSDALSMADDQLRKHYNEETNKNRLTKRHGEADCLSRFLLRVAGIAPSNRPTRLGRWKIIHMKETQHRLVGRPSKTNDYVFARVFPPKL